MISSPHFLVKCASVYKHDGIYNKEDDYDESIIFQLNWMNL